jgi:hypothetical protein
MRDLDEASWFTEISSLRATIMPRLIHLLFDAYRASGLQQIYFLGADQGLHG